MLKLPYALATLTLLASSAQARVTQAISYSCKSHEGQEVAYKLSLTDEPAGFMETAVIQEVNGVRFHQGQGALAMAMKPVGEGGISIGDTHSGSPTVDGQIQTYIVLWNKETMTPYLCKKKGGNGF